MGLGFRACKPDAKGFRVGRARVEVNIGSAKAGRMKDPLHRDPVLGFSKTVAAF